MDVETILTVIRRREWSHEKGDQHLDLHAADLHGANLYNPHLEGVDLTRVEGVTQEQINSAMGDDTTKLPPALVMPESWKKKQAQEA